MGMIEQTAASILRGDAAKRHEAGGQRFAEVDHVDADDEGGSLRLVMKDGRSAEVVIPAGLVVRPDKRTMGPADVHDAVLAAMDEGVGLLAADVP